MKEVLFADDGDGKEIVEYLREKLSIPENAVCFTVTFEYNSPIKVECLYYAPAIK